MPNKVQTYGLPNTWNVGFCNETYKSISTSVLSFNIPSISIGEILQPTPIKDLYIPGGNVDITEVDFEFMIEEDFSNYLLMLSWINSLKNFKDIESNEAYTDINIFVQDNKYLHKNIIVLEDCFPKFISDITLDAQNDLVEGMIFTSTFKVNNITIENYSI